MPVPLLLLLLVVAALMPASCRPVGHGSHKEARAFVDEIRLPTTPVKDQGASSLCWIYAMLAVVETDHIVQDDSINLSVDYVARTMIAEAALHYWQIGQPTPPDYTRGMPQNALRLMLAHGTMLYDAYHSDATRPARAADAAAHVIATTGTRESVAALIDAALDYELGPLPPAVHFLGETYTPQEMTHSLFRANDYEAYASSTHHPYGTRFLLEVPDNYHAIDRNLYVNVPLDTLITIIDSALRDGHAVAWSGDVTEPCYSFAQGIAELPSNTRCTDAERQLDIDTRRTTDDHAMAIIGIAHDADGRRFYIAKDSQGTRNAHQGYMYLSENYVRAKTMAIVVKRR